MRRAMSVAAVAIVCAAGAAWARGGHGQRGSEYGDGFITPDEVCAGGAEFTSQDQIARPWGGALLVPASLTTEQRAALGEAVRLRYERGGAVWRLVESEPVLPVGFDAMLFASCPTLPHFAHVSDAPSGGFAVRWNAKPPGDWVAWLAAALAFAEGDGPY